MTAQSPNVPPGGGGHDDNNDEPVLGTPEWETQRLRMLRCFLVRVDAQTVHCVFAHRLDTETAGHLVFYTMSPQGRMNMTTGYHYGTYLRFFEVLDPTDRLRPMQALEHFEAPAPNHVM